MKKNILGVLLSLTAPFIQAEEPCHHLKESQTQCKGEIGEAPPMEQSLHDLENKLGLSDSQQKLWTEWATKLLAAHHSMDEFRRTEAERRKLPAPERQEIWMKSVETHLGAMKASLLSLRALYVSLSDQQKAVLDREVPFKHGAINCGKHPTIEK